MKRRGVLVAFAVVLAVLGTVGVYAYLRGADKRAASGSAATSIVVATTHIAVGTTWTQAVRDGAVKVQQMPAASTPSDAVRTLDAGIGGDSVAQGDIAAGSPVLRQAFGPAVSQTGVLAIPKGKIAVTIQLSNAADVAGYIAPRSQVVVFVTANYGKIPASTATGPDGGVATTADTSKPLSDIQPDGVAIVGDQLTITRTVVSKAIVIATSQASPTSLVGADGSTSSAGADVLVTLALSQADAERVVNQQKVGQLSLGLLSADSTITPDDGYLNTIESGTPEHVWAK